MIRNEAYRSRQGAIVKKPKRNADHDAALHRSGQNHHSTAGYRRIFGVCVLFLYVSAVLWLTLIDRNVGIRRAILTPFWEYAMVLRGSSRRFFIRQILGNLLLLMPLGVLLPALFPQRRNPKRYMLRELLFVTLTALLSACFIELTQYYTGRGLMEFDDVFNNTLGAVTGYLIYCLIRKLAAA